MYMRSLSLLVLCLTPLIAADQKRVNWLDLSPTQNKVSLGALGLDIAAIDAPSRVRVIYETPGRILVTPTKAAAQVTQKGILIARLSPGKTYYFGDESKAKDDEKTEKHEEAGAGQPPSPPMNARGLPRIVWGTMGTGAAAVAAGIALKEPRPTSTR
jgi:hypothetical protein